eukprot:g10122.t1
MGLCGSAKVYEFDPDEAKNSSRVPDGGSRTKKLVYLALILLYAFGMAPGSFFPLAPVPVFVFLPGLVYAFYKIKRCKKKDWGATFFTNQDGALLLPLAYFCFLTQRLIMLSTTGCSIAQLAPPFFYNFGYITKCCLKNCPISRYSSHRMDIIDNNSVLDETCPGKSSWSTWERADILAFKNSSRSHITSASDESLPKPRYICQMRMEVVTNPLFTIGVLVWAVLNFFNWSDAKSKNSSTEEIKENYPSLQGVKEELLAIVTNRKPMQTVKMHFSACTKANTFIHIVGALLGMVASLGFIIDGLINTQPMIAPDYFHMVTGILGNIVMGTYLYDVVFLRIKATYDKVYDDIKNLSKYIKPRNDGNTFSELPEQLPESFKTKKNLKQWILVRQLLLEKVEPEYKYASISLSIIVTGCLYYVTFMLIRVVVEQIEDNRTPLQTLSQNNQNFAVYFGMMIVFLTWSINVLSQIISIGEEQQRHATILRKGAFACKVTNEDEEIGNAIAEVAETCADYIKNLDVYPKAILSLEIRPSMVYAMFGYIVSSIFAFIIAQATGGGGTEEGVEDVDENVQIGILVSIGLPAVYILFHIMANHLSSGMINAIIGIGLDGIMAANGEEKSEE